MSVRFAQAEELIQAVEVAQRKGAFQPDERLIVQASEFYDSFWIRSMGIQDSNGSLVGTWHKSDDVLCAVLSEIQGDR